MHFEHPQAFWLLTLSAPLAALYLVRRRAKKNFIASLALWERAVSSVKTKQTGQWPIEILSLVMNLVILACVALSLAEPVFTAAVLAGRDIFLVLDTSASMHSLALKDGRSRIANAADNLRSVLASAGPLDRCALIEAGDLPTVLATLGSGKYRINMMLDEVLARKPAPTRGCLREAVDFILQSHQTPALLAQRGSEREIVLVVATDGQEDFTRAALPGGIRLLEYGVRSRSDNAGIVYASVQRADEYSARVLVRIVNHSSGHRELILSARFVPETSSDVNQVPPIEVRTPALAMPGNGVVESVLEIPCPSQGSVVLSLLPADALMLDNAAELPVDNFARARVVLALADGSDSTAESASDENFLLAALNAMGNGIDRAASVRMSLEMLRSIVRAEQDPVLKRTVVVCAGRGSGEELVLFDGLDMLPMLSFGVRTGSTCGEETARNMALLPAQSRISWNESHPILRGVEPGDISVTETLVRDALENETSLAEIDAGAIALAGAAETGGKYVWFGFPLSRTNLTALPAFPLLLKNAIYWLGSSDTEPVVSAHEFPVEESNLQQGQQSGAEAPEVAARQEPVFFLRRQVLSAALVVFAGLVALAEWALFCWRPGM